MLAFARRITPTTKDLSIKYWWLQRCEHNTQSTKHIWSNSRRESAAEKATITSSCSRFSTRARILPSRTRCRALFKVKWWFQRKSHTYDNYIHTYNIDRELDVTGRRRLLFGNHVYASRSIHPAYALPFVQVMLTRIKTECSQKD